MKRNKLFIGLIGAVFAALGVVVASDSTFAEVGISMSPMNQKIILTPGETYYGSFSISNGASNDENLYVNVRKAPYYVNEEDTPTYDTNNGDYNQIVDWTTFDTAEVTLAPNTKKEIHFAIDVPLDAPAGGQYLSIIVAGGDNGEKLGEAGQMINVKYSMAHLVFAEIAGTTVRKGEVSSVNVPGFLFTGDISGTSVIKNTGNVHSNAHYTLQVFPLFSNEEVYTNEESPEYKTILPERSLSYTSYWTETPTVGIFNVVYTAEFEGVTSQVKKMVIVCPIWLLIIILVVVLLIIVGLISKSKKRK